MKKIVFLVAGFFLIQVIGLALNPQSLKRYFKPRSLSLRISSMEANIPGALPALTADLKSLVGNLSRIQVFFESSSDLEINSRPLALDVLASGTTKSFDIEVKKKKTTPGPGGSWVRVKVSYLPDYNELIKEISKDKIEYPDELQKTSLLKSIEKLKNEAQLDIQGFRFLFSSGK